jgi:O-antigen ligase
MVLLLVLSPLMRGGNRHVALIVLEAAALVFLAALAAGTGRRPLSASRRQLVLGFVVLSPAWLAVLHLVPLPQALWAALPGRAEYARLLSSAGIAQREWLPLSLVPDATVTSLLAALPLMAAFLAGYLASLRRLRWVLRVVVGIALCQVAFGLLQVAGGPDSSLYFGATHRGAFGTFANTNHFANYLAMGLAAYIWLAWTSLTEALRMPPATRAHYPLRAGHPAPWIAGAVFLMAGILMSQSRGAMLTGLPAALAAFALALAGGNSARPWRITALLVGGTVVIAIALVGVDAILARFDLQRLAADAPLRTMQASTTLQGAGHFWPLGAGWGTYHWVYPRFQPAELIGMAHHAHQDYAQMLFEGGIPAALLMAAFAWLAGARAVVLVRAWMRRRRLRRAEMVAALCGLGLLGFLLHSLLEFNMHIPANAIVAALLAGVYLRPLDRAETDEDRADD